MLFDRILSIDVLIDQLSEKPLVEIDDLVEVKQERVVLDSEDDDMEKESRVVEECTQERCIEEEEELPKISLKNTMPFIFLCLRYLKMLRKNSLQNTGVLIAFTLLLQGTNLLQDTGWN